MPRSGSFLSGPDIPIRTNQLSFEFCTKCALIRRKSIGNELNDYTHVRRATGHHTPSYVDKIVGSFRKKGIGFGEFIVEVGANDGAFLDILEQFGFTNRLGVEPSRVCAATCHYKGHPVENVHFDKASAIRIKMKYGEARAVVCRHTLKHVPDRLDLLLAMRGLLTDDGTLFIEVPDARGITNELRGHKLWDEHIHSFTPENLSMLVHQAGFRVETISVIRDRDTSNVLLWCAPSPTEGERPRSFPIFASDVQFCRRFLGRWPSLKEQIMSDLPNWPRPIVCIGASHPQSNFLLFTGLGRHVVNLVDDDPTKIGYYVPIPQPALVISTPQFLGNRTPGTILCTAFGYEDWMDELLEPLVSSGVRMVYPYETM